jgi:DNA-binding LytR/AlgR family response regulator
MNCIIVSDIISGKLLEEFVLKTSSLNLIARFSDSGSARDEISKRQDIDLIFLDLEILGMDSFDFVSSLACKPNIIMVSSTDQHALKAFDFNIVDYLLKPISYSRFFKSIDKAGRYYSHKKISNIADNEIFIKRGSALVKLKLKEIIFIEALENYVTLFTKEEKFTILFTMKGIESQLPSEVFIRIHRSVIVNKSMIQTINESNVDIMYGDTIKSLPLGKSFREQLLKDITLMSR